MNKKGFTLIELLAVIVIFGIILVVAIPEVLGYINKAKKDSLGNGADLLLSGISIVNETALSKDKPNGTYTITNGVIVEENPFSFDKKLSFDGTFTLDNGNISYTLYNSDGLCVSKRFSSNKKIYGVYNESSCEYEDFSDLFVFDEDYNQIIAYKTHDYIVNKDICVSTIKNDSTYNSYMGGDINKINSFCDGNYVNISYGKDTFVINLDTYIFGEGPNYIYDLEDDGVLKIIRENPKNIIIPSKINGIDVLHIGDYAFAYKDFESITLPDSILTIGIGSFEGNKLRTINFPKNLEIIGEGAFNDNLFPDDKAFVYSIDNPNYLVSYAGENRTNVVLPSKTITIGNYAFAYADITNILLNDGLVNINDSAFEANFISSIVLPSTVRNLGENSFCGSGLDSLTLNEGLTTIGSHSFCNNNITSLVIPSTVVSIGNGAFTQNNISNLQLNEGLTTIGSGAFYNNSLTTLTMPSTIVTLESDSFGQNSISTLQLNNGLKTIGLEAFTYNLLTTVNIPSSVTSIGNHAFTYNKLTNVVFSAGSTMPLNGIGYRSFYKTSTSNNTLTSIIYRGTTAQNWNSVINGPTLTSFVTGTVTNANGNVVISAN